MPLSCALEKVNDVVVASSLMTRAEYFELGTGGGSRGGHANKHSTQSCDRDCDPVHGGYRCGLP